ncbi:MAG: leucine-rich repeat protein [Clostridia bacterium]|nr:leucine-rich repeat protein [Clostridia bacterium]
MKKTRRIVAFFLSLVLIIGLAPVFSVTAENIDSDGFYFTFNEEEKTAELDYYNGNEKEVVIPETVNGYTVVRIDDSAFSGDVVTKVVIPNSVKEIGMHSFSNCTNLQEVVLSNSLEVIGEYAFYDCTALKKISAFPDTLKTIGTWAFRHCENLTDVSLNTTLKSIGQEAFYGCTSIDELNIPQSLERLGKNAIANTAYYESLERDEDGFIFIGNILLEANKEMIGTYVISEDVKLLADNAFDSCTKLYGVVIPGSIKKLSRNTFNNCVNLHDVTLGEGIVDMGCEVFSGCTFLSSITIPETVESMNSTFFGCYGLKEVNIPSKVKSLDGTFINCTGLKNIVIPDTVEKIGYRAFLGCKNLSCVDIPSSVTIIDNNAFTDCAVLKEIVIPESVTEIGGNAFDGCNSLEKVEIPSSVKKINLEAFKDCTSLTEVIWAEGCESIGYGVFSGCTSLTEFEIPASIKKIYRSMFKNCTSLKRVEMLGEADSVSVSYMFFGCWSLESAIIKGNAYDVNEYSFKGCGKLTNIVLPDTITWIGEDAFKDTAYYKEESNWEDGCLYVGNYLIKCKRTSSPSVLNIKEGTVLVADLAAEYNNYRIVNMPESLDYIGKDAFSGGSRLEEVNFPVNMKNIGSGAFANCWNLKEAILPEGITYVPFGLFYSCAYLSHVVVPEGVTEIRDKAFYSVQRGLTLELPSTLESIGDYAVNYMIDGRTEKFDNTVIYNGTLKQWGKVKIGEQNFYDYTLICEETEGYDLSELFIDYEEKSLYEMVEFIADNQETYSWVNFFRDSSETRTNTVYIHMAEEFTNKYDVVPNVRDAGLTDNTGKYLVTDVLNTVPVVKPDADTMPGNVMIGEIGNKMMTVEISEEFIEHINSLNRLDGNVLILDFLMNILSNEEVVGVSWAIDDSSDSTSVSFFSSHPINTYEAAILGDCNGDGAVNAIDSYLMKQAIIGYESVIDPFAVDLNGDGRINACDSLALKTKIVKG